jgi:hypothetical protein
LFQSPDSTVAVGGHKFRPTMNLILTSSISSSLLDFDLLPRRHHLRPRSLKILMRLPHAAIPVIPDPREKFLRHRNILESIRQKRVLI